MYKYIVKNIRTFDILPLNINTECFAVRFPIFKVKMADYKCFECQQEFATAKLILSHLKIDHHHKDNYKIIKCVINLTECDNVCRSTFLTFGGLRKHLKICIKKRKITPACGSSINQELDNDSAASFAGIDDVFEFSGDQV